MAGADTTGTAMGSILRFMITNPDVMARARAEIDAAEQAGYLSEPVQYEETRSHLPYFVACIKEGLRLNPPATNLFSRVVASSEGVVIDGVYVPPGTDVTCHAYSIHRYPGLHGNDSESFKPERWLTSNERTQELESSQFTFGVGPRTCIGKDVSIMEMYKLLPEVRTR
jgi:cytochrome P450